MEAAVVVFVALTLIIPVAAILPYTTEDIDDSFWNGKKREDIVHTITWGQEEPFCLLAGDDVQITGWAEGDSRRPSMTQDSQGHIFITWQQDVDLFQSSLGTTYNDDPSNKEAWWEHGRIDTISSGDAIAYPDTAF